MHSERWEQIKQLYDSAVAQPVERRAALLDYRCQSDPELRRELESLLQAREEAGAFLRTGEFSNYLDEIRTESAASLIGRVLVHYEILSLLGIGGMGIVYRARDTRLNRHVALKVLSAEWAHQDERVARFQMEARAASALNHVNIITIYDVGEADGTWFIAGELVEGITLRERLAAGKLLLSELFDISYQVAAALAAAHAAHIVHRDIKPENIMIRPDGVVKVVDFGIASVSGSRQQPVRTSDQNGFSEGTPGYMSPEQLQGDELDSRTDIFSLGVVLYEMLSGQPARGPKHQSTPTRSLNKVIRKAVERDRDRRYQTVEELAGQLKRVDPRTVTTFSAKNVLVCILLLLLVSLAGIVTFVRSRAHRPLLGTQDTVLLGDFRNQTGDTDFDLALKAGLAVQLEQSPLLHVFSDERLRNTLQMMGRPTDSAVTEKIGQEICAREGLKAMVTGSIAPLGRHFVITLQAIDSHTGDMLARAQVEARTKEDVLNALSLGAARLREKLGESLPSIQKYDALLERTTSSLEALRAFSLGDKERRHANRPAAIAFFQKAIELDPHFAYAYAELAALYRNTRLLNTAREYSSKAYALKDQVSERERLRITAAYYKYVTGDLEKSIETLKTYQQIYPRDPLPYNSLSTDYSALGRYDLSLQASRAAMRLDPDAANYYSNAANALIHLNRFAEAKQMCDETVRRKFDNTAVHHALYRIALLSGDQRALERELQWSVGRPDEYTIYRWQAGAAASQGRWRQSAQYANRAVDLAMKKDLPEIAGLYLAEAALRASVLGKRSASQTAALRTTSLEHSPLTFAAAQLALELSGGKGAADAAARQLAASFPDHTLIRMLWVPLLNAAGALDRGDAAAAVESLRPAVSYEPAAEFWPQYLRGQAYLKLGKGSEARAEFRKILLNRGQSVESLLYPLAYLGLARSAVILRDQNQAREAYQEFLTRWQNADRDILPVNAARTELNRLPE